jgi:hypothetical protein
MTIANAADRVRDWFEPQTVCLALLGTIVGAGIVWALLSWAAWGRAQTACSSGDAAACRVWVMRQDRYDDQRALLTDYRLATGEELR